MHCPNCGNQILLDARFCYNCGMQLPGDQPQPVPYPAPYPMAVPPPAEKKIDVPSLVLSIVGLVFAFFFPFVTFPCSIVGLVFAIKRKKTHKTTAALVMCIVGLALAILITILSVVLVASIFNYFSYFSPDYFTDYYSYL